jgi:predicted nucleic acid-binding protein
VIALDTNLLVYAHREDSPFHEAAFRRVAELAEGAATWAIPWPCVHEFVAIVTHLRIYAPPTPLARALDQVDAWLESPTLVLLAESAAHWPTLRALLADGRVAGPQSMTHE